MAVNEFVQNKVSIINHNQFAQTGRREFVPGKLNTRKLDSEWPIDFEIPLAKQKGKRFCFERGFQIGRKIISDYVVKEPIIAGELQKDNDWIRK